MSVGQPVVLACETAGQRTESTASAQAIHGLCSFVSTKKKKTVSPSCGLQAQVSEVGADSAILSVDMMRRCGSGYCLDMAMDVYRQEHMRKEADFSNLVGI